MTPPPPNWNTKYEIRFELPAVFLLLHYLAWVLLIGAAYSECREEKKKKKRRELGGRAEGGMFKVSLQKVLWMYRIPPRKQRTVPLFFFSFLLLFFWGLLRFGCLWMLGKDDSDG